MQQRGWGHTTLGFSPAQSAARNRKSWFRKSQISCGMVPTKSLKWKNKRSSAVSCPISDGIVPVMLLALTVKDVRRPKFVNSRGIVPVISLFCNAKTTVHSEARQGFALANLVKMHHQIFGSIKLKLTEFCVHAKLSGDGPCESIAAKG